MPIIKHLSVVIVRVFNDKLVSGVSHQSPLVSFAQQQRSEGGVQIVGISAQGTLIPRYTNEGTLISDSGRYTK